MVVEDVFGSIGDRQRGRIRVAPAKVRRLQIAWLVPEPLLRNRALCCRHRGSAPSHIRFFSSPGFSTPGLLYALNVPLYSGTLNVSKLYTRVTRYHLTDRTVRHCCSRPDRTRKVCAPARSVNDPVSTRNPEAVSANNTADDALMAANTSPSATTVPPAVRHC